MKIYYLSFKYKGNDFEEKAVRRLAMTEADKSSIHSFKDLLSNVEEIFKIDEYY